MGDSWACVEKRRYYQWWPCPQLTLLAYRGQSNFKFSCRQRDQRLGDIMMFAKGSERFPPPKDITPGPGAYDPKLLSHDVGFKEFAKQAGDRFSDDIQEGAAENISV